MTERDIDGDGVEVVGTFEQRMLTYAERQAKALDTLTQYALWWSMAVAVGMIIWLAIVLRG